MHCLAEVLHSPKKFSALFAKHLRYLTKGLRSAKKLNFFLPPYYFLSYKFCKQILIFAQNICVLQQKYYFSQINFQLSRKKHLHPLTKVLNFAFLADCVPPRNWFFSILFLDFMSKVPQGDTSFSERMKKKLMYVALYELECLKDL